MTEVDVPITEAFELYLRSHFFKLKQNKAAKKTLSYWMTMYIFHWITMIPKTVKSCVFQNIYWYFCYN